MNNIVKYFRKHKKEKIIFIELSFLFFAYFLVHIYLEKGSLASSQDLLFNYQRLEEVWKSIIHFHIPLLNQYTSLPYGLATPTLYPWILEVPFSIFVIFNRPIQAIIFMYIVVYFIGLNVAFYTYKNSYFCKQSNHKILAPYGFACIYVVTGQAIITFCSSDVGSLYGTFLFPLVFFGWTRWIKSNKWLEMTIGLSLILYGHIVTTLIGILGLIILTVSYGLIHKTFLRNRYKSLCKSILLFTLLTSIIWIPIIALTIFRDVDLAQTLPALKNLKAPNFQYTLNPISTLGLALFPAVGKMWIFSDVCSVLLGFITWRRLPHNLRYYHLLACLFLLIMVVGMNNPHISPVISGYISRGILLPHILLSVDFIYILLNVVPRALHYHTSISIFIIFMILNCLNIEGFEDCAYSTLIKEPSFMKSVSKIKRSKKRIHYSYIFQYPILKNNNLNSSELLHFQSHCDYFPKNYDQSLLDANNIVANSHTIVIPRFNKNNIIFKLNRTENKVDLPIATYKNQKIQLYVNNKQVPIKLDHNGMVKLTNVHKGTYRVHITESFMWYRWLAVFLTLIGYIILGMIIWNRKKHSKKLEE